MQIDINRNGSLGIIASDGAHIVLDEDFHVISGRPLTKDERLAVEDFAERNWEQHNLNHDIDPERYAE